MTSATSSGEPMRTSSLLRSTASRIASVTHPVWVTGGWTALADFSPGTRSGSSRTQVTRIRAYTTRVHGRRATFWTVLASSRLDAYYQISGWSQRYRSVTREFDHGKEPRAEEIALHQRFLTLLDQMEAARSDGDESEVRRLGPLLERARKRWLTANLRVTRER